MTFDVSSIPRNAVIHEATIELTRDSRYSLYSRAAVDSLVADFVVDSTSGSDLYEATPPTSIRTGNIYRLKITTMVQRWVKGYPNQGIRIKAFDDFLASLSRCTLNPFAFYNSRSDTTLKPRLKIIYSTIR
jgi:hypothetical protein